MIPKNLREPIPGAKNFTWAELIHSNTADARKIDNTPTNETIFSAMQYLAEKCLQPARDHFGLPLKINSGYRGPAVNRAVGGSKSSFHLYGCAADVVFAGQDHPPLVELFRFFQANVPYTELIAENLPHGWVHVAIQKGREVEKQLKYMIAGQGVKRATLAEIERVLA